MSASTLLLFVLVMSTGIMAPGPTVMLAMSNASRFGMRWALVGMAGAVAADLLLVGLVSLGLGAVLTASETLFVALKWIGAAWLAYVGIRMLCSDGSGHEAQSTAVAPERSALFMRSFFIAMSNPKYYLFLTALLPQFVDRSHAVAPQYVVLAAIIVIMDFSAMVMYATIGMKAVAVFKTSGVKWMNRIGGGLLLCVAGSVALYRRSAT